MAHGRIERWLGVLADEGEISSAGVEPRARFLATVVMGLMVDRALPGAATRVASEAEALRFAVRSTLASTEHFG